MTLRWDILKPQYVYKVFLIPGHHTQAYKLQKGTLRLFVNKCWIFILIPQDIELRNRSRKKQGLCNKTKPKIWSNSHTLGLIKYQSNPELKTLLKSFLYWQVVMNRCQGDAFIQRDAPPRIGDTPTIRCDFNLWFLGKAFSFHFSLTLE